VQTGFGSHRGPSVAGIPVALRHTQGFLQVAAYFGSELEGDTGTARAWWGGEAVGLPRGLVEGLINRGGVVQFQGSEGCRRGRGAFSRPDLTGEVETR